MIHAAQDVLNAEARVRASDLHLFGAASTTNAGIEGVSRATCVVPSSRSRRTSTSVIVAARPAMWIVAAGQSTCTLHAPAFGKGVVDE